LLGDSLLRRLPQTEEVSQPGERASSGNKAAFSQEGRAAIAN